MIELLILDKLCERIPPSFSSARLISLRKLSTQEVSYARRFEIKRFYLPALEPVFVSQFYNEFNKFWDEIIEPFDSQHPFWRNVVSSKIQEWERSAIYFILTLLALEQISKKDPLRLIVITGSIEEEDIVRDWANKRKWIIQELSWRLPGSLKRIKQDVKNALVYGRFVIFVLIKKNRLPKSRLFKRTNDGKESILIASLFYPWSFQDKKYRDPFFHDLHNFLEKQGKRCMYIADSLSIPSRSLSEDISACDEVIVNVPCVLLTWGKILACSFRVFFRKFPLKEAKLMGCDFSKLIQWNARRSLNGFNLNAELFYEAVASLCQKEHFDRLLFIFEGNVFERACIQAFRKFAVDNVAEYSHAVIFSLLSLKLHLTQKESKLKPEANRYICTGPYGKKLLVGVGSRPENKLFNGCALRNIPTIASMPTNRVGSRNILVVLDGVWSSSYLLDWLIEYAEIFKDFDVSIRAHPNVPMEEVRRQCLHELPANFIVSQGTLKDDILKSLCVLYRHTSAGVQALLNGIPVIYLAVDSPLEGDPLEELKFGKWLARNPEEMKKAIEEILSLGETQLKAALDAAKRFANNYFSTPTEEIMSDFV